MTGRFKLEILNSPDNKPIWFDDRESLDNTIALLLGCPVDDGPLRLKVTEFGEQKVEYLSGK